MAISVTSVMRRHPECFDRETRALLDSSDDPFDFPGLELTRTADASQGINFIQGGAIIIAGSGMCTGGRIKHHLKHNIWRAECSLVFVGFQAEGTLGRMIVDGAREVPLFESTYLVNAKVYTIGGFSSHADREMLLRWLEHAGRPERLFLVHGERRALDSFAREVARKDLAGEVDTPGMGESFSL
jgi:metallo-beta-lactamase family protein